jgi:flagellar hook protein FlgE
MRAWRAIRRHRHSITTTRRPTTSRRRDDLRQPRQPAHLFDVLRQVGGNTWDVYTTLTNPAGASPQFTDLSGGGKLGTLTFDQTGSDLGTFQRATITDAQLGYAGAISNLSFPVNFPARPSSVPAFSVNAMVQDGYGSGTLAGFNVGQDGTILGRYTNGQTAVVGQVILAAFRNSQGLQPLGDNVWAQTPGSGDAIAGVPGPRASMACCIGGAMKNRTST